MIPLVSKSEGFVTLFSSVENKFKQWADLLATEPEVKDLELPHSLAEFLTGAERFRAARKSATVPTGAALKAIVTRSATMADKVCLSFFLAIPVSHMSFSRGSAPAPTVSDRRISSQRRKAMQTRTWSWLTHPVLYVFSHIFVTSAYIFFRRPRPGRPWFHQSRSFPTLRPTLK